MAKGEDDAAGGCIAALYRVMQSVENNLGGGEGVEGLYGSVARAGTARVLAAMARGGGLGPSSVLVDVGAGLGRPLLHALLAPPGLAGAYGVEVDAVKCAKAGAFCVQVLARLRARGQLPAGAAGVRPPDIRCAPIEALPSLGPATHAYSFWEGVPAGARAAFGRLCAASPALQCVAVVQRAMRGADPAARMAGDYGFPALELVAAFPVAMSGSGRSFMAYVFTRPGAVPVAVGKDEDLAVGTPPRDAPKGEPRAARSCGIGGGPISRNAKPLPAFHSCASAGRGGRGAVPTPGRRRQSSRLETRRGARCAQPATPSPAPPAFAAGLRGKVVNGSGRGGTRGLLGKAACTVKRLFGA